ncbi:MAG TPA: lytic murein transglycosylase [Jiangellaceae bacterium]|nr:lytic murein transglycosylase [Jiangellaceae bacterium]
MKTGLRYTAGAVAAACALALFGVPLLPGSGPDPNTWIVSTESARYAPQSFQVSRDFAQAEPLIGIPESTVPRIAAPPGIPGPTDDRSSLPVVRRTAVGSQSIPATVLAAYRAAAERIAQDDPSCGMRWQVLAGIGKIESGHAGNGRVTAEGDAVPRILGPVLDGAGPVAAISDHDDGRWDLDSAWDRAVGPMQFIPGTWALFGVDGSGDGIADPNNVFDATLSAGRYLCVGDSEVATSTGLATALRRYNNSAAYVATVMSWINAYDSGNAVPADDAGAGSERDDSSSSPSPTLTPTPEPTSTGTPTPTPLPSPTPTVSPTPSASPTTPTRTPTSPASTQTPSSSASPCPTPSPSPSPTPTPTPTGSPTPTPTPTPTDSPTPTPTPSPTPTGCAAPAS